MGWQGSESGKVKTVETQQDGEEKKGHTNKVTVDFFVESKVQHAPGTLIVNGNVESYKVQVPIDSHPSFNSDLPVFT